MKAGILILAVTASLVRADFLRQVYYKDSACTDLYSLSYRDHIDLESASCATFLAANSLPTNQCIKANASATPSSTNVKYSCLATMDVPNDTKTTFGNLPWLGYVVYRDDSSCKTSAWASQFFLADGKCLLKPDEGVKNIRKESYTYDWDPSGNAIFKNYSGVLDCSNTPTIQTIPKGLLGGSVCLLLSGYYTAAYASPPIRNDSVPTTTTLSPTATPKSASEKSFAVDKITILAALLFASLL